MAVVPSFVIKRNDTLPVLSATLSTVNGPINLTGAMVYLVLTPYPTPSNPSPVAKVRGLCSIVGSPSAGNVQYNWTASDTSVAGNFLAEFEIDISGSVQSVPTTGYIPVQIIADLG